jgi:hypothetical protein
MAALAVGWWGDFVGWLEGHDASALVLAAFLTFLVTGILAGVTAVYAVAARRQAEATLRPVISLWTEPSFPKDVAARHVYTVYYHNIGNGPAMDIYLYLTPADGDWFETRRRVGMGVRDEKTHIGVEVHQPVPDEVSLVAEYDDGSGSHWKTTLSLEKENGVLRNGRPKVKRIRRRTEQ